MDNLLERLGRMLLRARTARAVRRGVAPSFRFRGRTYWLNPDESAIYHIVESTQKIANMTSLIPADTAVIFDVGGNCGLFSAFAAASCPTASIHCFEPSPVLLPIIRRNVAGSRVAIHEVAAGEATGDAEFFIDRDAQQANSLSRRAVELFVQPGRMETRIVRCTALDQFAAEHGIDRVDVLKVDVQGAESAVFRGARRVLQTVGMLFVESTWMDVHSITGVVPLALEHGFTHASVINPVYMGADLLLSRAEIRGGAVKLSFPLDRELLARHWG
jgi:FkbM family methyltransferase